MSDAVSDGLPRLLLCHNYYKEAGGESLVFDQLVRGLRQVGHPVSLYTRENEELDARSLPGRVAVIPGAFAAGRSRRELRALVVREKPVAALVQNVFPLLSPSVYTTLSDLGVPVIQLVYNYRFVCANGQLYTEGSICERCVGSHYFHAVAHRCYRTSRAESAWYAAILQWNRARGVFHRSIDAFMVPDRFMMEKLAEGGFDRGRMHVSGNPFFAADYVPNYDAGEYVLFAGRLIPEKGVRTLLEAMRRTSPPVRLVVVGQGPLADEVREAEKLSGGRITFTGPKWGDELTAIMGGSRAVVVPSEWYDSLPLVLCQANAMGKPVVAARINGIPEYVDEGENGLLFQPGDAGSLAAALDTLFEFPAERYHSMARTSRRKAESAFDFGHYYGVLENVIDRLRRERAS